VPPPFLTLDETFDLTDPFEMLAHATGGTFL
jgi:hypothetical protein